MTAFFQNVLTASFHGSIVILAVLILRLVLRKTPKKFICFLWVLAGLRLLMPIPVQSSFSLQPQSITIPISLNLTKALPFVWVAVAMIIAAYSFWSYVHLRKKVHDAVPVPGGWESDQIDTAFVLGFIKPKIYIPTGMSENTRDQILAHERTHLDKGDHWIKMVGFLALALHWFNPLVWVSYILLCKDIEMACDERVVQFMELDERKAYSAALLKCSTKQVHYAACPVAFGEVSVKYRIKSVLNYRKPSFWISLLGVLAICFVALCLVTSPKETEQVYVDPQEQLEENSKEDPADFIPAVLPELEPNPDWGVDIFIDVTSPTGGTLVYKVEERFAAASGEMKMHDVTIDRWNGNSWEPMPSKAQSAIVLNTSGIGFAQSRDDLVNYFTDELDWSLVYGSLPAGDYRLRVTIDGVSDSAEFQTAFHIYREKLPAEEEAALARCTAALDTLCSSPEYTVLLSQDDLEGNLSPVMRVGQNMFGRNGVQYLYGEYCISSYTDDEAIYVTNDWDAPFRLNQNRQFLFPEGQSTINQEKIQFRSVWTDFTGTAYQGTDTFLFKEDGSLKSIERLIEVMDGNGNVVSSDRRKMETEENNSFPTTDETTYDTIDTFDTSNRSPWGIYFRVDDDLLSPSGGEVWFSTDAVGISNYYTDGNYWLERKHGSRWERLGSETTEASFGEETIPVRSRTEIRQVDWTSTYGELDPGVYRMGKRFYNGEESIIQYSEFAIYSVGGVYGEGAEEAIARVDAAIAKLQSGNYRVEKWEISNFKYDSTPKMTEVIWKYGETVVNDFYKQETYSHSFAPTPGDFLYDDWIKRDFFDSAYDSTYFPKGYSVISDSEIRFVYSYSQNAADNPARLYTYRFDESGNLTEILEESCDSLWSGYTTHYIITDTPESEIASAVEERQAWIAQRMAQQS